jgi:hypothetical protein
MCRIRVVDDTIIKVCSMITRRTILFYVQAPLFVCAFSCGLWIVDFRDSYLLSHIPSGTLSNHSRILVKVPDCSPLLLSITVHTCIAFKVQWNEGDRSLTILHRRHLK